MMLSRPRAVLPSLSRSLRRSFARPNSSTSATDLTEEPKLDAPAPTQAPNFPTTWSTNQRQRPTGVSGPRFEQAAMELQPNPLSAMEMIANEPIRMVHGRKAVCDGGFGPLGHPKVYINLDKPGPRACGYCGLRFEQVHDH